MTRLLIINPNISPSVTALIEAEARRERDVAIGIDVDEAAVRREPRGHRRVVRAEQRAGH